MFSPNQNTPGGPGGPAMATRSRRRQRPVNADNSLTQQPKAKRQRRPLRDSTFVNPDSHKAQAEMLEVKPGRLSKFASHQDGIENFQGPITRSMRREFSLRPKKPKQSERANKSDGSVELSKSDTYIVSKLQALPDKIRADPTGRQHGVLYSSIGCGLCLTHTHALVWNYAAATPSPETFVFTLPHPSKKTSAPLPLGSLVPPGTRNEDPGLVVVMPTSGKISFWEHISSAATLEFIWQQRSGVEDTIPGMLGGEHVTEITEVDSSGFILSLSSGRLAHLSVRDGQGKPAISIHFLRATCTQTAGAWPGVLDSLRNALKPAVMRGDIAAVRVNPSYRTGPKKVVVAATKNGRLRSWEVQRGGPHEITAEIDAREAITKDLKLFYPSTSHDAEFEVIDFAYVPKGIDEKYADASRLTLALGVEDDSVQHLLLLISLSNKRESHFALVEVVIQNETLEVGIIRTISSYTSPIKPSATKRPRLYLPRPGLVAFLVFDRAVVVASVAAPPETPESQLHEDNHVVPATYEDMIDLRNEDSTEIVGSGLEEMAGAGQELEASRSHRLKSRISAALLMVRGVGVVRVALSDVDKFASEKPPMVTAKIKLEQAVFYGHQDGNPLVFEGRRDMPFSDAEVGAAALELSNDILASANSMLPVFPASMELNLRQRGTYMDRLMSHLNAQSVRLDRRTRWQLLSNAEKMHAAREVWKLHETFLGERTKIDKKTAVSEAIECIAEEEKKNPDRNIGELDRARTWFVHDIGRLEIFVAWTYQMIKHYHKEHLADDAAITRFLYEGIQVYSVTLHGALEFRQRTLDFYGLGMEDMRHGILSKQADYQGLPEFWTSTSFVTNNLFRLNELSQIWLDNYYPTRKGGAGAPDGRLIESIRNMMAGLCDQIIISLTELVSWAGANGNAAAMDFADKCKAALAGLADLILKLKDYGLWDEALQLAEKYSSDRALAELIVAQIKELRGHVQGRGVDSRPTAEIKGRMEEKKRQFSQYTNRFGAGFAFEAYRLLLAYGGIQIVSEFAAVDERGFATEFLRDDDRLGKISWIHDVEREKDMESAAKTLIRVGQTEDQLWNKKIQLSMGKLTLMSAGVGAEAGGGEAGGRHSIAAEFDSQLGHVDRDLELVRIQDYAYKVIFPTIEDAVDEVAAVDLAMQEVSPKIPKRHKVFHDDLRKALHLLVTHKVMQPFALANLLSLMKVDRAGAESAYLFFQALRVADLGLEDQQRQNVRRLIWRRCYISDPWDKLNYTENMSDQAVLDELAVTKAYGTMVLCYRHCLKQYDDTENSYILGPEECQGVFTDRHDEVFSWYEKDDGLQGKRAEAMRWEDSHLKKYVDKNQLSRWAKAAHEVARRELMVELDVVTATGANGRALKKARYGEDGEDILDSIESDE